MSSAAQETDTQEPEKSQVSDSQRLVILTPASHSQKTVPPFLLSLTGTPVATTEVPGIASPKDGGNQEGNDGLFAGYTTHSPLQLNTKYYTAGIPIWVDEVPVAPIEASTASPLSNEKETDPSLRWSEGFLAPEVADVRSAIGAILVLLQKPPAISPAIPSGEATAEREHVHKNVTALKPVIQAAANIKRKAEEERSIDGGLGEVPALVVLVGSSAEKMNKRLGENFGDEYEEEGSGAEEYGVRWWEDELAGMGIYEFEVVEWDPSTADETDEKKKKNELGELEGMPRIREVLEANEWTGSSRLGGSLEDAGLFGSEDEGLDLEVGELEREMLGLRMAIQRGGDDVASGDEDFDEDDLKVEQLEGLMLRVQAIRDMGADIPESERKQFAAKAIRDIMKDL